jgi:hypothetical protein
MFELDGEARDDGLSKAVNTKRAVTKMGKYSAVEGVSTGQYDT